MHALTSDVRAPIPVSDLNRFTVLIRTWTWCGENRNVRCTLPRAELVDLSSAFLSVTGQLARNEVADSSTVISWNGIARFRVTVSEISDTVGLIWMKYSEKNFKNVFRIVWRPQEIWLLYCVHGNLCRLCLDHMRVSIVYWIAYSQHCH